MPEAHTAQVCFGGLVTGMSVHSIRRIHCVLAPFLLGFIIQQEILESKEGRRPLFVDSLLDSSMGDFVF